MKSKKTHSWLSPSSESNENNRQTIQHAITSKCDIIEAIEAIVEHIAGMIKKGLELGCKEDVTEEVKYSISFHPPPSSLCSVP